MVEITTARLNNFCTEIGLENQEWEDRPQQKVTHVIDDKAQAERIAKIIKRELGFDTEFIAVVESRTYPGFRVVIQVDNPGVKEAFRRRESEDPT